MAKKCSLPPDPQHAVLKRIYPWDDYNINMVMQCLYSQAVRTGFRGTFEDFKLRYGAYVQALDPQETQVLIENYTGTYHIIPLVGIDQVLHTENKVLNADIIVEQIPENIIGNKPLYGGGYYVIPRAYFSQILKTKNTILEDNVVVGEIPYAKTTNQAGGYTAIIG